MASDPFASSPQLAADAEAIFRQGVAAVQPRGLIARAVRIERDGVLVGGERLSLGDYHRIVVVGAGKASGGMAAALVELLQPHLQPGQELTGWVNVPDDCRDTAGGVRIHCSRPVGENLPTERVVAGTRAIRALVRSLTPRDLCFCLVSGGGSALLAAPVSGLSLADKRAVSRLLAARGASIQQLNQVRRQLSEVKGGRLVAGQQAGRFVSLILSDVLGDPLELIASGPTVFDPRNNRAAARAVLSELGISPGELPAAVRQVLDSPEDSPEELNALPPPSGRPVLNLLVGSLSMAVAAAAAEARRRGYEVATEIQARVEVTAVDEGRRLAGWIARDWGEQTDRARAGDRPVCLISGGEPVVKLCDGADAGGRNQELVLAAVAQLLAASRRLASRSVTESRADFCLLSAGTDGEDGSTTAAGAFIDGKYLQHCRELRLDPTPYLRTNDSHRFFQTHGGLFLTGPTGTNVGDLRIVLRLGGELPRSTS